MKNNKICFPVLSLIITLFSYTASQAQVIDRIIAVVGKDIILKSDIESQFLQYRAQGIQDAGLNCDIFEELLTQKLLLQQAYVDSIEISESQIESEMDRRLRYFISQIGSQEKLEAYYNKSINEIKADFKPLIQEQMLVQQVQSKIIDNIKITPSEVRRFFNALPPDSLPLISSEVEIGHIVKIPEISQAIKDETRQRLNTYRERIVNGADFTALAVMYSDDPGSARKGGELGFFNRGELYPEYETVAFGLAAGEISPIVETKAGFHIIQLIERRGERINTRHILLQPRPSVEDIAKAKNTLDSVYDAITAGSLTFEEAVIQYSDDPSKNNAGIIVNPNSLSSKFETSDLEPSVFFVVDKMILGEISNPVPMRTEEGLQAYRILYLKSRT
ncbi:MAG: peptidylprolyl isomerase, partial [Bacteroidales bacterium]|nr:peptidylprolyl isomerase [Bacteroidales bacterium]